MHIVVLADELLQEELLATGLEPELQVSWVRHLHNLQEYNDADAYFDLLFENTPERIERLQQLQPALVIVAAMEQTAAELPGFIRINAWPGFLRGNTVELAGTTDRAPAALKDVFHSLHREVEWVPDQAGFVTPRVVAMIINEAYFALGEALSSREEIDIAMKAGVNYPYGPFEWAQKIGLARVCSLLTQLSQQHPRYAVAPLLQQEAAGS